MSAKHPSIALIFGCILTTILFISLAGMTSTVIILESSEGDAENINVAGSLRMYAMRIALAYSSAKTNEAISQITAADRQDLINYTGEFDSRLQAVMSAEASKKPDPDDAVTVQLNTIHTNWKNIRDEIIVASRTPAEITSRLKSFVTTIDGFVTLIQLRTENKLNKLKTLLSLGIITTVLTAFIVMWLLNRRILQPLKELVVGARLAQSGDFSFRAKLRAQDELGEVALAYNNMAESLGVLYTDLEARVKEKTEELQIRNDALLFLNQAARTLAVTPNSKSGFIKLVNACRQVAGFHAVTLEVYGVNSKKTVFQHHVNIFESAQSSPEQGTLSTRVELFYEKQNLGFIEVDLPGKTLLPWQQQLLDTFADLISKAFGNMISIEREHRLLLVEERATIARELHDSIAQTLSFLKIQIARFNHLIEKDAPKQNLEAVALELKEGIAIAYQQLREVLTTFRLQAHEPGLEQALKSAISEYTQRGNLTIKLNYQLKHLSPSANEEMHILQIIREALTNIVKHANATKVWINLSELKDSQVIIQVQDDGMGMIKTPSPFSHGMTIMNERASQLGGSCSITSTPRPLKHSPIDNPLTVADETTIFGTTVEVQCRIGKNGADDDTINPFAQ